MLEAFKAGGDFHSRTAMNMYPHIREALNKKEVLLEWHPQPGEDKPPVPLLKVAFDIHILIVWWVWISKQFSRDKTNWNSSSTYRCINFFFLFSSSIGIWWVHWQNVSNDIIPNSYYSINLKTTNNSLSRWTFKLFWGSNCQGKMIVQLHETIFNRENTNPLSLLYLQVFFFIILVFGL